MPSTVEILEGLERRLSVTVPADVVEKTYQSHLTKAAKSANLKGFRPGKVPVHVIETKFGQGIRQDVAGELLESSFQEAVKEHKLQIAGQPRVEGGELKKGEALEYVVVFDTYPEIELKELDGADIEKITATIGDTEVNEMIEQIRSQHSDWEAVERPAKEGDRITIDFEGFIEGKPFDGGEAKDFELELGSKQMIPGFEEALLGAEKGRDQDIEVTFPEEYPVKDLAGKPSMFKIKVHQVMEPKLPAVDDALAEKAGIEGGVEGMKKQVRDTLERELNRSIESFLKNNVLDKLLELNPITIPEALIDAEIQHLQQMTLQQMAASQGKQELPKMELPRDPYVEQATKRVALGLLLAEVIRRFELKVDAAKVRARVEELASTYQKPEEVIDWYYKNKQLLSELEAGILEEDAVALLLEKATIKEKPVSYEEAMKLQHQRGQ